MTEIDFGSDALLDQYRDGPRDKDVFVLKGWVGQSDDDSKVCIYLDPGLIDCVTAHRDQVVARKRSDDSLGPSLLWLKDFDRLEWEPGPLAQAQANLLGGEFADLVAAGDEVAGFAMDVQPQADGIIWTTVTTTTVPIYITYKAGCDEVPGKVSEALGCAK